jgi:uncharacterized protein
MQSPISHKINNHSFWLTTDRAMFWEEENALIVSDLHFGKTGHFRKSGIAVPSAVYKEDLQRLVVQIQYFQPKQLIIVGDMFHSRANLELDLFLKWRSDLREISIRLVRGNHDMLEGNWYDQAGIQMIEQTLSVNHFHFIHDINDQQKPRKGYTYDVSEERDYFFSGHIHPGIRINGTGRQSLCFPCFYFAKSYAVLPAFSRFTGIAMIYPDTEETVFAIVNKQLIRLN